MKKNIRYLLLICALLSLRVFAQDQGENFARAHSLNPKTAINGSAVHAETSDAWVNNHKDEMNPGDVSKSFDVSPAYPNPASGSATIEYTLPEGSRGKLMLRNLAGSIVREVNFESPEGRIIISTNDLTDGLYFYSVLLNNRVEVTRKLMVRH